MRPIQTLAFHAQPDQPGMGKLTLDHSAGVLLPGAMLAAQYHCESTYLVLTTQDSPFEETLHISLFDEHLQLLDAIELGQPYTGAVLGQLEPLDEQRLRFTFFTGDRWELRLRKEPGLGGAALPKPARRRRAFWHSRYLDLQCLALPSVGTP